MTSTSGHLSFDRLVDLVQDRLLPDEQGQAHLAICRHCSDELAGLERMIGLMRGAHFEEAPAHTIARSVRLLRRGRAPASPGFPQRVAATLRFDSLQRQPALAVRGGRLTRQMLFSAAEYSIDLRITPSRDMWAISGQLLGSDTGGLAELSGPETTQAHLNELGRFNLPAIPAGDYTLLLLLEEVEIMITDLDVGA